jgi:hypothetical protein
MSAIMSDELKIYGHLNLHCKQETRHKWVIGRDNLLTLNMGSYSKVDVFCCTYHFGGKQGYGPPDDKRSLLTMDACNTRRVTCALHCIHLLSL